MVRVESENDQGLRDADGIDDVDDVPCYRHPSRMTALRCGSCDRPVCVDCAVHAPVGIKCRDCARLPRQARAEIPTVALVRAVAAGVALAMLAGVLFHSVYLGFSFFTLILGFIVGAGIAEGVRIASGGFRGQRIASISATSAFAGVAWPVVYRVIQIGPSVLEHQYAAIGLVVAAIAAVSAFRRAS